MVELISKTISRAKTKIETGAWGEAQCFRSSEEKQGVVSKNYV